MMVPCWYRKVYLSNALQRRISQEGERPAAMQWPFMTRNLVLGGAKAGTRRRPFQLVYVCVLCDYQSQRFMYSKVILCKQPRILLTTTTAHWYSFICDSVKSDFTNFFRQLLNSTYLVGKCQSAHFSRSDTRLCFLDWTVTHSITVKRLICQFSSAIQNFVKSYKTFSVLSND